MRRTRLIAGLGCALVCAAGASASPPIMQPGAPGQDARPITPEQSVALSRTGYTPADVRFMQHMIVHHQQAVDMVAMIEARTDSETVARMGRRIALTQEGEMAQMRRWLEARGEPLSDADLQSGHHHGGAQGHGGHGDHAGSDAPRDPYHTPLMTGMLSPAQMDALAAAQGAEFDRLFLEGMIHHHQGALIMVDGLLARPGAGEETTLSEFLTHVVADQSAEILRMRNMLSAMDVDPSHEGHVH